MREFWNTIQLIFTAIGGWLGWFLGGSDSEIGVTMNTYTHLGLEDAQDELRRMEELEQARKEVAGKGSETA